MPSLPVTFWTAATVFPNSSYYVFDLPHGALPVAPSATWTGPNQSTVGGPSAAAYDSAGNYYAIVNNVGTGVTRILKYTPGGIVSTLVASGVPDVGNTGLAIDGAGNLYLFDNSNGISFYTAAGAGPTQFISSTRYLASGNGAALSLDYAGNLIVFSIDLNTGNNVLLSISPAAALTVLNANVLPTAIEIGITVCFDSANNVYVLWNTSTSGFIAQFNGAGALRNQAFATLTGGPFGYLWFWLAYDPIANEFFALGIDNGAASDNKAVVISGAGAVLGPLTSAFVFQPGAIAGPPPPAVAAGQPFLGTHVGFWSQGQTGGGALS